MTSGMDWGLCMSVVSTFQSTPRETCFRVVSLSRISWNSNVEATRSDSSTPKDTSKSIQFLTTRYFSSGLAAVKIGEKWGFVDATGSQVIPPKFDAAYYFRDGVAVAGLDSGEVLIDKTGKTVASGYRIVGLVTAGRVPASRDDKEGYLDPHGEITIPFLYESVRSFSGGLAAVKQNGKWGYLDRDGRVVIPFAFDDAGPFAGGLAPAKLGSKTGFIDTSC